MVVFGQREFIFGLPESNLVGIYNLLRPNAICKEEHDLLVFLWFGVFFLFFVRCLNCVVLLRLGVEILVAHLLLEEVVLKERVFVVVLVV